MTKIHDLRSFLAALDENGRLLTVNKEVGLVHEIGSVIATAESESGKGVLFKNVSGSPYSLAGGMLASMENVAVALGVDKAGITDYLSEKLDALIDPVIVEDGPVHENVITGDAIDMTKVPVPTHAPLDGGPIITGGVIHSKSIHGGRQNLSFQRMHVKGKDKVSIMINDWRHLKEFYDEAEAEEKPLPISIVIGCDPVIYIAAGLRTDDDETCYAGALRGEPIKWVKSVTNDVYVPAEAEFVIEAEILPHERELEGPLGEFTGHYSEPWNSPVMRVTAICHRNDAIYQTINGASFEHINLGNVLTREPLLKRFTKYVSNGVIDVHIPPYGDGFLALIQIEAMRDQLAPREFVAVAHHHFMVGVIHVVRMIGIADEQHVLRGEMAMDVQGYTAGVREVACFAVCAAATKQSQAHIDCLGLAHVFHAYVRAAPFGMAAYLVHHVVIRHTCEVDADVRAKFLCEIQVALFIVQHDDLARAQKSGLCRHRHTHGAQSLNRHGIAKAEASRIHRAILLGAVQQGGDDENLGQSILFHGQLFVRFVDPCFGRKINVLRPAADEMRCFRRRIGHANALVVRAEGISVYPAAVPAMAADDVRTMRNPIPDL